MRTASIILAVMALAGGLTACSDEPEVTDRADSAEPRTPVDEVTVDQLLENPGAYDGAVVIVRDAEFIPIEPKGAFVLQGEEGRILVSAPNGVPELEKGERVPLRGELVRFTEPAAEALGSQFADAEELADTPTDVGDPYLLLRAVLEASADVGATPGEADLREGRAELAMIPVPPS